MPHNITGAIERIPFKMFPRENTFWHLQNCYLKQHLLISNQGRLSPVDLLNKIACFGKKVNNISNIKSS